MTTTKRKPKPFIPDPLSPMLDCEIVVLDTETGHRVTQPAGKDFMRAWFMALQMAEGEPGTVKVEARMVDGAGRIIARSGVSGRLPVAAPPPPPEKLWQRALRWGWRKLRESW